MSWNYRIVRHTNTDPQKSYLSLREVYYDETGKPTGMSKEPTTFVCDVDDGESEITAMLKKALDSATSLPVLDDPWPDEHGVGN